MFEAWNAGDMDACVSCSTRTSCSDDRRVGRSRGPIVGTSGHARLLEQMREPWDGETSNRSSTVIDVATELSCGSSGAWAGQRPETELARSTACQHGRTGRFDPYRSGTTPKPSKPWGCRSKTLTPTPEPAGYCAGDVAGERGDRASGYRGVDRGGLDGLRERYDPDVVMRRSTTGRSRTYLGRDAVWRFFEQLRATWDIERIGDNEPDRRRRPGRRGVRVARRRVSGPDAANRGSRRPVSTHSQGQGSSESSTSGTTPKPSKPWASRSRRCRRRTWRSCGALSSTGTADWMLGLRPHDPDIVCGSPMARRSRGPIVGHGRGPCAIREETRDAWTTFGSSLGEFIDAGDIRCRPGHLLDGAGSGP